ncbi:hypothetical protein [Thermomonas sp.]|uniref:hypothetical protein n=1 Tax=Thermomonas sp. TaxID=1971895 RepID=UPI0026089660|nr:hypothetical protein [Thermomonas sp.]
MIESASPCPACGCAQAHPAHAVVAKLRDGDLDAALALGLLDMAPCAGCGAACNDTLAAARDNRRFSLAARDRHRARARRLARIKAERETARRAAQSPPAASGNDRSDLAVTDLPKAASDALARALARARERHS